MTPALDDLPLARALPEVRAEVAPDLVDAQVDIVENLLHGLGADWDRRWHRISVIASATADTDFAGSWLRRRPNSPDALVLFAWSGVLEAWRTGAARDPDRLIGACVHASAERAQDPNPWVVLLALLRILKRPPGELAPVWAAVKERQQWHREAHLQLLGYLSADECGSTAQVQDFLHSSRLTSPAGTPIAALGLIAAVKDHRHALAGQGVSSVFSLHWWRRPAQAQLLAEAVEQWLRAGYPQHAASLADLNVLAYASGQAGRQDWARSAIQRLEGVVTWWPWSLDGDPLTEFRYWRSWARKN